MGFVIPNMPENSVVLTQHYTSGRGVVLYHKSTKMFSAMQKRIQRQILLLVYACSTVDAHKEFQYFLLFPSLFL